eukprot:Hpha_TRINITY_DN23816_c0_g1::TRINITY_DN23816_c0_g1_i1::g.109889::m.109889
MADDDMIDEEAVALSGGALDVDIERIKNMSAEEWRAERKRGIRTTILGPGAELAKAQAARDDVPPPEPKRAKQEPLFSRPTGSAAAPGLEMPSLGGKAIFYQEGQSLASMTALQQDDYQRKVREDRAKLSELNTRLQRFRQVQQEERPAHQSTIINELEEMVLQGRTLEYTRAEQIITELRRKLPPGGLAEIQRKKALAKAQSVRRASKAGRLMIALTGSNPVDERLRGGMRKQAQQRSKASENQVSDYF